jgi:hypothetical protein
VREASACLDVAGRVRRGRRARRGPLSGFSTEAEGNKGRRWGSGMGRVPCGGAGGPCSRQRPRAVEAGAGQVAREQGRRGESLIDWHLHGRERGGTWAGQAKGEAGRA